MSNRNFDASVITKRLGNKAIAKSIISNFNNVNSQPQTSNMNASIINEVELGNSLFVTRGPTCTTYDLGCPCPIISSQSVIPQIGWFTRIAGAGNNYGYGVARDSDNNIIVIGVYQADITIYNINGTIFGTLPNSGSSDTFIVKYNSSGTGIWATRIAGTADDFGYSVAVDSNIPDNNIIVTGYYLANITIYNTDGSTTLSLTSTGGVDVFIVKYNSNGTGIWATRIAGGGSTVSPQPGLGVSVDSFDNSIIVTGYYGTTITIYNATPLPSGSVSSGFTLINTSGLYFYAFIVKYSSLGISQWATRITGATGDIFGAGVKVDSNSSSAGDIIVTGSYTGQATIYTAPGTVVFGTLNNTTGIADVFVVKYNSSGTAQWKTRIAGTGIDRGYGIAVDSSKNIIVTGYYTGTVNFYYAPGSAISIILPASSSNDAFIIKYSSIGQPIWVTRIGGANDDRGYGIVVDSLDNIIVTGYYNTTPATIYDASPTPYGTSIFQTLTNSGNSDVFIVKYNSGGYAQWATRIAGTADDQGNSITVDSNNNIIVTGSYDSSPVTIYNTPGTLVAGTLVNTGLYDAFLVKYTSNGFVQLI